MRKLAIIRNNNDIICPFGLSIASDCGLAGDSVDEMQEIKDQEDKYAIIQQNLNILNKNSEQKQCKYAISLFKNKDNVVNCNFGDTAAGFGKNINLDGSNYYTQVMDGTTGIGGLLTFPTGNIEDIGEIRNLYYGIKGHYSERTTRSIFRQGLLRLLGSKRANE